MNCHDLINLRYKIKISIFILIIIFVISLLWIINRPMLDVLNTYGYVKDDFIIFNVLVENPDTISKLEYLKINDLKLEKIDSIGNVMIDEEKMVAYQEVKVKNNQRFLENEVLNISLYYNEEKVSKKLKKLIF